MRRTEAQKRYYQRNKERFRKERRQFLENLRVNPIAYEEYRKRHNKLKRAWLAKQTPEWKAARRAYERTWAKNNLERVRQHSREIYARNRDKFRERSRQLARQERSRVLEIYGSVCVCCGESRYEFLSFDHINGGGAAHRRAIGKGTRLYLWLKKNGFPSDFRILCHNCNQALGAYGYCPHTIKEQKNQ
jgi:hypothetical protein